MLGDTSERFLARLFLARLFLPRRQVIVGSVRRAVRQRFGLISGAELSGSSSELISVAVRLDQWFDW